MKAIRGAITVARNTEEDILKQSEILLRQIIRKNALEEEDILSIFFSATSDLTKAYPARAARKIGLTQTAMACYTEMNVEDSLPMCIRVLMHVLTERQVSHIYLEGARALRPDWEENNADSD